VYKEGNVVAVMILVSVTGHEATIRRCYNFLLLDWQISYLEFILCVIQLAVGLDILDYHEENLTCEPLASTSCVLGFPVFATMPG
jgi:hypothetical protein